MARTAALVLMVSLYAGTKASGVEESHEDGGFAVRLQWKRDRQARLRRFDPRVSAPPLPLMSEDNAFGAPANELSAGRALQASDDAPTLPPTPPAAPPAPPIPQDWIDETSALAELYNTNGGAAWRYPANANWLNGQACIPPTWHGIVCRVHAPGRGTPHAADGRVQRIFLPRVGLNGTLPTSLGKLQQLVELSAYDNVRRRAPRCTK